MSDKGTKNQGLTVWIGTTAASPVGDTFVQVKRVKSVSPFGGESPVIDATTLEDVAREKLKGIPDSGNIDLTGNYVQTDPGQAALAAAQADNGDVPYNCKVVFEGAGAAGADVTYSFKALVTKFNRNSGDVDGIVMFDATLAVTGPVAEA